MGAPYSLDLRKKVIETYQSESMTQIELAQMYNLSLSTIKRYLKKHRETGDLMPVIEGKGRPSAIDEDGLETIENIIKTKPSITLLELSREFFKTHRYVAGRSVLSRACQKLNLGRKKLSVFAQERERSDVKKKGTSI